MRSTTKIDNNNNQRGSKANSKPADKRSRQSKGSVCCLIIIFFYFSFFLLVFFHVSRLFLLWFTVFLLGAFKWISLTAIRRRCVPTYSRAVPNGIRFFGGKHKTKEAFLDRNRIARLASSVGTSHTDDTPNDFAVWVIDIFDWIVFEGKMRTVDGACSRLWIRVGMSSKLMIF